MLWAAHGRHRNSTRGRQAARLQAAVPSRLPASSRNPAGLDLAGAGDGHLVFGEEQDAARYFEAGQAFLEEAADLVFCQLCAFVRDDAAHDQFAQGVVGNADGLGALDAGAWGQDSVGFQRGHVGAGLCDGRTGASPPR